MRKTLSILMVVALTAVLAVSCATIGEKTGKIVILNAAVKEVEPTDALFNGVAFMQGYDVKKIVEKNFKYKPAADTLTVSAQINDFGWQDTVTYGGDPEASEYYLRAGFQDRAIIFQGGGYKELAEDEDTYLGGGIKYDYRAYYTGITVVGHEAILLMQKGIFTDGYSVADIINTVANSTISSTKQTVASDNTWKVITVNGKSVKVSQEEFESATLAPEENNGAKFVFADGTEIAAVRYIEAVVKAEELEDGVVYRFVVAANAKGVYGKEVNKDVVLKGTWYPTATTLKLNPELAGSFSIAEILDNAGVEAVETVKLVSEDGTEVEVAWDSIRTRYFAYHKSNGMIQVGGDLLKSDKTNLNKIAYMYAGDVAFAFVSQEDGYYVSDLCDATGYAPTSVKLTYLNGSKHVLPYDLVKDVWFAGDSELLSVELF